MRLLLPPSESKGSGTIERTLQLETLTAATLTSDRQRAVAALAKFCAKPSTRVRTAIGTSVNQDDALKRNANILDAPTAPAFEIYNGVLFDAIDLANASKSVRARIVERVLVQSALFGVVGFGDAIPAYRCSADSTLPRLGRLGAFWRERLHQPMSELVADEWALDLRSGPYATMWTPKGAGRERFATVKVMQERDGKRQAVSHFNKATKGHIVRALCELSSEVHTTSQAIEALAAADFEVALVTTQQHAIIEVMCR